MSVNERLAFDFEVKLSGDQAEAGIGTIEGYGSVFGNLDRGGDIVAKGAFKDSLAAWRKKKSLPPMLWQHDSWQPIGVWTSIEEDDAGLKVAGELILDVKQASEARALVLRNAVKGLSIGYLPVDYAIDKASGARILKKVDLWEISLVTFPMNTEALVSNAKADFDPRAYERALRAEGFSESEAKRAVSVARKMDLRDGGQKEQPPRDGPGPLLMSLRKATAALGE